MCISIHLRKINRNNYFPTFLFQLWVERGQSLSWQLRAYSDKPTLTPTGTIQTCQLSMHIFGIFKETRVSRENPHRSGNRQSTQTVALAKNHFLISVITTFANLYVYEIKMFPCSGVGAMDCPIHIKSFQQADFQCVVSGRDQKMLSSCIGILQRGNQPDVYILTYYKELAHAVVEFDRSKI